MDDIEPVESGAECEGCDVNGIRSPANPSCMFDRDLTGWIIVERCDYCEKFPDDEQAALAILEEVEWIDCVSGGEHVIGRTARRKLVAGAGCTGG